MLDLDDWHDEDDPQVANRKITKYELKRTWRKQTCWISGKTIWPLSKAWCKPYYHYHNNQLAFEHWICEKEYTFALLKGKHL